MTDFADNAKAAAADNVTVQAVGGNGSMRQEDVQLLDRYRALHQEAEAQRARVREVRARIREQTQKVGSLEGAAREARNRYQETLSQPMARGVTEQAGRGGKEEVARLEGDLAEASGLLRGLEAELPRIEAAIPHDAILERAKRDAWHAVVRDLESKVPREVQEFVAKIYAAMLNHYPDAPFSGALTALCPAPPSRQLCSNVSEQVAREYNIPAP